MTAQTVQNDTQSIGDLVAVQSAPAEISVNFEEAKKQLASDIAQYDVVVTEDTVADAKKLATELNKMKTDLGRKEKAAVDAVSAPIKAFKEQMKELKSMCEEGRQGILVQVSKFEQKKLNQAQEKLTELRDSLRAEWKIDTEFYKAEFDDLIKLGSVTGKGNLAKSAKDTLTQRVREEKHQQERVEKRLLMLENASYKAGLKAPLTRAHVESFLFLDDEQYQQRLDAMLASELEREARAAEAHRQQFQQEQDRKEADEKAQAETAKPEPTAPAENQSASEADQIREAMAQIQQKLNYEDNPDQIRQLNEQHMALELELAELEPVTAERIAQIENMIAHYDKGSHGPNAPDWTVKINKARAKRMRQHLQDLTGRTLEAVRTEEPAPYSAPNNTRGQENKAAPTTVAPLDAPDTGKAAEATLSQAEDYCLNQAGAWGVWRDGELYCICYQGRVYRPDVQQQAA